MYFLRITGEGREHFTARAMLQVTGFGLLSSPAQRFRRQPDMQEELQKILFYAGRRGRDGLPGGVLQWSTAAGTQVTLRRRCLQCPIAGQGSTRFSHVMHPTAMDCLAGAPVLPS